MAEQIISGLVDPELGKQLEELKQRLTDLQGTFSETLDKVRSTSKEFNSMSKDAKSFIDAMAKYEAVMRDATTTTDTYKNLQAQITEQKRKLKVAEEEEYEILLKLKQQTQTVVQSKKNYINSLDAEGNALRKNTKEYYEAQEASRRLADRNKQNAKETLSATDSYNQMSARLVKLRQDFRATGDEGVRRGLLPEIKKLDKELKRLDNQMGINVRNVGNYSGAIRGVVSALKTKLGVVALVTTAINFLTRSIRHGFQVNVEFEKQLSILASVAGGTRDSIRILERQALELGTTTEWTASKISEAQVELAKLGFGVVDISNMTPGVLGFATALGTSIERAATVAGQTLRAFNIESSNTTGTLDLLTKAAHKSAMDFEYIERSIAIVGASASVANLSLKDTLSMLGVLSNSGLDASRSATALRNIILYLSDESKKLGKAMKGTTMDVNSLWEGLTELTKAGVNLADMFELTDKRAVNALAVLIQNKDQILELNKEMDAFRGTLERIRNTRLDTTWGDITIMKNSWDAFWISFRDNIPVVRSTIQWITEQMNYWTQKRMENEKGHVSSNLFGSDYSLDEVTKEVNKRTEAIRKAQKELNKALSEDRVEDAKKLHATLNSLALEAQKEEGDNVLKHQKKVSKVYDDFLNSERSKRLRLDADKANTSNNLSDVEMTHALESGKALSAIEGMRKIELEEEENYYAKLRMQTELNRLEAEGSTDFATLDKLEKSIKDIGDNTEANNKQLEKYKHTLDAVAKTSHGVGGFLSDLRKETSELNKAMDIAEGIEGRITDAQRLFPEGASDGSGLKKGGTPSSNLNKRSADLMQAQMDAEELAKYNQMLHQIQSKLDVQNSIWQDGNVELQERKQALDDVLTLTKEIAELEFKREEEALRISTGKSLGLDPNSDEVIKITEERRKALLDKLNRVMEKAEVDAIKRMSVLEEQDAIRFKNDVKSRINDLREAWENNLRSLGKEQREELDNASFMQETLQFSPNKKVNDRMAREAIAEINKRYAGLVQDAFTTFIGEEFKELANDDMPPELKEAIRTLMEAFSADASEVIEKDVTRTGIRYARAKKGDRGITKGTGSIVGGQVRGKTLTTSFGKAVQKADTWSQGAGEDFLDFLNSTEVQGTLAAFDALQNVMSSIHENQLSAIDARMEARAKEFEQQRTLIQQEIDLIGERQQHLDANYQAGLLSEENYRARQRQMQLQQRAEEKRLRALEKQQRKEEEQADKERKKVQLQQAKWNKANNIVQSIMNTAMGVGTALSTGNIPLSIILGVLGAAQTAIITAQKIPEYAEGTLDHKGGLMVVGDGGRHEYVVTPDKKVTKTPNVPTLMSAPKHTKVLKDDNAMLTYLFSGDGKVGGSPNITSKSEEKEVTNIINVDTDYREQRKLLTSLNVGINKLRANELYRIELERHNKLFDRW